MIRVSSAASGKLRRHQVQRHVPSAARARLQPIIRLQARAEVRTIKPLREPSCARRALWDLIQAFRTRSFVKNALRVRPQQKLHQSALSAPLRRGKHLMGTVYRVRTMPIAKVKLETCCQLQVSVFGWTPLTWIFLSRAVLPCPRVLGSLVPELFQLQRVGRPRMSLNATLTSRCA